MTYATGFFGVPGSRRGNFTVHVVDNLVPICGWRPATNQEFQWCANGIVYDYIECHSCKKLAGNILRRVS